MFGKLLKYDFRAMLKQFAFIWPAALALAVVNHFTLNSFVTSTSSVRETVSGIAMLVYVAILIAMFIVAVIFVIQRFYKGLLGDEGYLMHTLPVKPWQLIGAKLLTAVSATFVNVVVALFSIFLLFPWTLRDFQEILRGLGILFTEWNSEVTSFALAAAEFILFMLISFATGYLQLYLSMSVGHLFSKNRVAMSVIAFIAINVAVSTLGNMLLPPLSNILAPMADDFSGLSGYHAAIWLTMAGELVLCAAYFAGTDYILRRRLNLE